MENQDLKMSDLASRDLRISDLITEERLMELFKISKPTIRQWRVEKGFPAVKLGRKYYVLEQDFMNWFLEQKEV